MYTEEECLRILENIRWGGKPTCPYCGSQKYRRNEERYQCNECFTSYRVTVGTFLHKTHIDLKTWFIAIKIMSQEDHSGRSLAQKLKVHKNTGCYLRKRILNSKDSKLLRQILKYV